MADQGDHRRDGASSSVCDYFGRPCGDGTRGVGGRCRRSLGQVHRQVFREHEDQGELVVDFVCLIEIMKSFFF